MCSLEHGRSVIGLSYEYSVRRSVGGGGGGGEWGNEGMKVYIESVYTESLCRPTES